MFIANVLKCRPPGNRDPLPGEIENCHPYLRRQVELIEPRVICTLGNFATKLLREDPTGISRLHGRPEVREIGGRSVRIFPIYHPAAALYTPAHARDAARGLRPPPGPARPPAAVRARRRRASPPAAPRPPVPSPRARPAGRRPRRRRPPPPAGPPTAQPTSWGCSEWAPGRRFWPPRRTTPAATAAVGAGLAGETCDRGTSSSSRVSSGRGRRRSCAAPCRALGVDGPVTSPTFALANRYRAAGGLIVSHLDLYRLAGLDGEDPDLLADYLGPDRLAFVEWPGAGRGTSGRYGSRVSLRHAGGDRRTIEVSGVIALALDTATSATVVGLRAADGTIREARDDVGAGRAPAARAAAATLGGGLLAEAGLGSRTSS